jgi:hypothetical protein
MVAASRTSDGRHGSTADETDDNMFHTAELGPKTVVGGKGPHRVVPNSKAFCKIAQGL